MAFKDELRTKINESLLRTGAEGLASWLREECKPAFHHEVVVAACLCSFDKPCPEATWTWFGDLREEKGRMVLDALVQLSTAELLSETEPWQSAKLQAPCAIPVRTRKHGKLSKRPTLWPCLLVFACVARFLTDGKKLRQDRLTQIHRTHPTA